MSLDFNKDLSLRPIKAKNHDINIRIHVESMNPALHLYERLGFHRVTENGLYFLLEYKPLN